MTSNGARREVGALRELARACGIQPGFEDTSHRRRTATPEALFGALEALGEPVEGMGDVDRALRRRGEERRRRLLEPVVVAWNGRLRGVSVRLPANVGRRLRVTVTGEDGEALSGFDWDPQTSAIGRAELGRRTWIEARLDVPERLPHGYAMLRLDGPRGLEAEAMVISAPRRAYASQRERSWGVFVPLYALRTAEDWGVGDFTSLGRLADWTAAKGGDVVAILPVLSALLHTPFEPSPYSPSSRLFWNELYLDVEAVPEVATSPQSRRLLASAAFQRTFRELRNAERVDYRAVHRAKERVLSKLATAMSPHRRQAFDAFVSQNPAVQDYAAFQAAAAQRSDRSWPAWPARQRDGHLQARDGDPADRHYHGYVQFLAFEQLQALSTHDAALHLDLPLGVHPDGYDVWRHRESFAAPGARGGAPPDSFFTKGQDWGFPPLHPERIREQRYAYPIACYRALMRHAGILRVDHVMGLHRLFWIPDGLDARDGVYVKYRPEELYAILSLESHRHRTTIVGEDLGTVPRAIRSAMARHGLHRSYVTQLESKPGKPLPPVQRLALASVNTHDMAPFAGFWEGRDIDDRLRRDLLSGEEAQAERTRLGTRRKALVEGLRSAGHLPRKGPSDLPAREVLPALLAWLGASEARVVVASLEDLWGETEPQNRPGTSGGANWSRRARHRLEEFDEQAEITGTLMRLAEFRVGSGP